MIFKPTFQQPGSAPSIALLTLLELSVAMTILAVLAAVVIVVVGDASDTARTQTTQATLRELQTVILNRYALDMAGKSAASSHVLVRRSRPLCGRSRSVKSQ